MTLFDYPERTGEELQHMQSGHRRSILRLTEPNHLNDDKRAERCIAEEAKLMDSQLQ